MYVYIYIYIYIYAYFVQHDWTRASYQLFIMYIYIHIYIYIYIYNILWTKYGLDIQLIQIRAA